MTYRELAAMILDMPEEILNLEATVFDVDCDEFRKVINLETVENNVLINEDHPVIIF